MNLASIKPFKSNPDDINVVIEIAADSGSIKYEIDKDSGALCVDRFMPTAMHYPMSYGFIPNTLADDGDPTDVLVYSPEPILPGSLIRVRAIGVLNMTDESGEDAKIIALPIEKLCAEYAHIKSLEDLPQTLLKRVEHFFERYKDLEEGKWVKISGWGDKAAATKIIEDSLQ